MLKLFRERAVWPVSGHVRSIGFEHGALGDVVDRCNQRMRSYLVLEGAALAVELPSFEMSQVTWALLIERLCVYCCCFFRLRVGPMGGPGGWFQEQ